jgi:hypothetical protein
MGSHWDEVLGQEFSNTQGLEAWRLVMVQEPGTVRSFMRPFPTNFTLNALQNGPVGSLLHVLALRKGLVMQHILHVKGNDQHFLDF